MTTMIPAAKPLIGVEEREAVDRVLQSGMLAQGPEVAAFEKEFSDIALPLTRELRVSTWPLKQSEWILAMK
jgi:hypothetical protein